MLSLEYLGDEGTNNLSDRNIMKSYRYAMVPVGIGMIIAM